MADSGSDWFTMPHVWQLMHLEEWLVCCRTPLIAAVAANVINLGLDLLLIFGFGMGVAGAALATSASQ